MPFRARALARPGAGIGGRPRCCDGLGQRWRPALRVRSTRRRRRALPGRMESDPHAEIRLRRLLQPNPRDRPAGHPSRKDQLWAITFSGTLHCCSIPGVRSCPGGYPPRSADGPRLPTAAAIPTPLRSPRNASPLRSLPARPRPKPSGRRPPKRAFAALATCGEVRRVRGIR